MSRTGAAAVAGRGVWSDPVLAGRVLAGRGLAGRVLAGRVLAERGGVISGILISVAPETPGFAHKATSICPTDKQFAAFARSRTARGLPRPGRADP